MAEEYNRTSQPRRSSGNGGFAGASNRRPSTNSGTSSRRPGEPGSSGRRASGNGSGTRHPRRKKKRSLAARLSGALLYVLMVIGVSAILATVGWIWANDVLALNKDPLSVTFTVEKDESFDKIVDQLEEKGLIEYKFLFKLFAAFTHSDEDISAGTYELDTDMDYRALLLNISRNSSTRQVLEVMIPEGYTVDQIFALLEERGVSTVEELQNMAATYDYKFIWLQNVIPLGDYHRLEGYLFPDTYNFYAGEDPKYVLNKMLANFERKMEDYFDDIAAQGHTLREIVNIASMIEKETDGEDQATIASVIYNRLNSNEGGTNGYLQIDATLVYINGGNIPTEADKSIQSGYNTYLNPGLPEGPISNPGMAALYAAMNPENTNYYYYALGDDGVHHFYRSYSDMQSFMATQERYGG